MDIRFDQFKVGDTVRVVGEVEELVIDKIWLTRQGPYKWVDYEARTWRSNERRVVSVEYDDGEWEVVLYDQFPDPETLPLAGSLPSSLTWEGATFRRAEKGRCTMRLVSHPGDDLDCTYADYSGPNGAVIAVELFGDPQVPGAPPEVELYLGRELPPTALQLFAPVDTQERPGLILSAPARQAAKQKPSSVTFTMPQIIIGAVAIAIVVVLLVLIR